MQPAWHDLLNPIGLRFCRLCLICLPLRFCRLVRHKMMAMNHTLDSPHGQINHSPLLLRQARGFVLLLLVQTMYNCSSMKSPLTWHSLCTISAMARASPALLGLLSSRFLRRSTIPVPCCSAGSPSVPTCSYMARTKCLTNSYCWHMATQLQPCCLAVLPPLPTYCCEGKQVVQQIHCQPVGHVCHCSCCYLGKTGCSVMIADFEDTKCCV